MCTCLGKKIDELFLSDIRMNPSDLRTKRKKTENSTTHRRYIRGVKWVIWAHLLLKSIPGPLSIEGRFCVRPSPDETHRDLNPIPNLTKDVTQPQP